MGKHDHDPAAPRHLQTEPLEALDAEDRLDLVRPQADHLCRLHPVAGVGAEGLRHKPTEGGLGRLGSRARAAGWNAPGVACRARHLRS